MSALARYFIRLGSNVAGYDRTSTSLTDQLMREGMNIHFQDDINLVPESFRDPDHTIIIYTPAIPASHTELNYFRNKGFKVMKRSEMLGLIANEKRCIAIAGTHGKTTISSMVAWIMHNSEKGCNAFLGGISKNIESNLIANQNSEFIIVEADEFDRSFLHLKPEIALITAIDADHLDVYGDLKNLRETYQTFVNNIKESGSTILKHDLDLIIRKDINLNRYQLDEPSNYFAGNIKRDGFSYSFDVFTPDGIIQNLQLGIYGKVNLENAIAAIALCDMVGVNERIIREYISTYQGVQRRFDVQIEDESLIYIDDYAHHPEELRAFIASVREARPGKRISGIFQPHLYTRTRDFADEFAQELSKLDDVVLLDIYPAREEPLEGISGKLIFEMLTNPGEKVFCSKEQLFNVIRQIRTDVWLSMGAGDVDELVPSIRETLMERL